MTLKDVLLLEAETTYGITENLFRRVKEEELPWTPPLGKRWMTVGQLLMHCPGYSCGRVMQGFVTGDWGTEADGSADQAQVPPPEALPSVVSVSQALELLAADRRLAVACIRQVGEASLMERKITAPWGGPEMPLFQQLLHGIAHLTQHKGQLFYYLKLMGRDVDTADLWGA